MKGTTGAITGNFRLQIGEPRRNGWTSGHRQPPKLNHEDMETLQTQKHEQRGCEEEDGEGGAPRSAVCWTTVVKNSQ